MEESPFAFKGFLVERVLDHLETEELLACAEVNRLWQSVALSLLRRKLISVSVRCAPVSRVAFVCGTGLLYDTRNNCRDHYIPSYSIRGTRAVALTNVKLNDETGCVALPAIYARWRATSSQDSERAVPVSALGSSHVCVDIFCSKFARYRNIARLAGLRPSLVFLSYHADLNEDKRIRLREFLPPDSVIVYCKLELARTMYDDVLHEGIFGEFLFSADEERSSESGELPHLQLVDGAVPGPLSLPSGPSRHKAWWRPRIDGARTTPPLDIEAVLPSPSTSAAPLQFPWAHGYRQASAVGGDGGAVFRNVLPGVLVFKSLRVTEANIEGNAVTSHFVKEATEKTVQITSATVFGGMSRSQLDPFIRRLSEQFGSTDGTIAMAFPRNQDEALGELEAFERCFPSVPALANQATEFNVDGPFAPMSRLKLVLLLIKLLD
ncbi:hypothetical protein HPB51_002170 [Rhipicephalus microplus]|uniref:F-box domain-containing protein n=1 Tax=Rhipicephalus microplus TaxID=6941 RepID=A0A9J6EKX0_RHIMP|nr:hypothetical protein HPB51_002170 [Rhipicephalus microplus]